MIKRAIALLSVVFLMACLVLPMFLQSSQAGANSPNGVNITVVMPKQETAETTETAAQEEPAPEPVPPVPLMYPTGIYEIPESRQIIKTYELNEWESPDDISRESFMRGSIKYDLADITKAETAASDTREQVETTKLNTATNNTEAIIKQLAPTIEYNSEDGYIGVLTLDVSSIKVVTAGSKTSAFEVSATREYPNLSSNDSSSIPKTISDNGKTLTLSGVEWRTHTAQNIDFDELPATYTGIATYSGTGSKTVVTGYVTTAEYKGTVSKITPGKTVYTAIFNGTETEPTAEPDVSENTPEKNAETPNIPWTGIITALLAAVVGGVSSSFLFVKKLFKKTESKGDLTE